MKTITIVVDTWTPQINGVITTYENLISELENRNYKINLITPNDFTTVACPTYKEMRISIFPKKKMKKMLKNSDAIHIATEGPLGWSARKYCLKNKISFSSSFHTKLPEYIYNSTKLFSIDFGYKIIKNFHKYSNCVLVPTHSVKKDLEKRKIKNVKVWSRGVNLNLFKPQEINTGMKKPIYLNVGRVSTHKNLDAFLSLKLDGTKVIVGDGPDLKLYREKYKDVVFTGYKQGKELAYLYNIADVFVFPSFTDTFGLVQIEALACGVPVAAFPVAGPIDIIKNGKNGYIDQNLKKAIKKSLKVDKKNCRKYVEENHSWSLCADQFIESLCWI